MTHSVIEETLAEGTIVRSDRLHGVPFGTVTMQRNQFRLGKGWGRYEYKIDRHDGRTKSETWVDENHLQVVTLDEVLTYYREREDGLRSRINKLRDMVGTKVPKYNPDKHLNLQGEWFTAFRHENGSLTYVFHDADSSAENPRDDVGTVATLIQLNSQRIDLDVADASLDEARDRFAEPVMRRYLAMFRPDIVYYTDHWSTQSDSYGWGYITREAWEQTGSTTITPEARFDAEVKVFDQWASGEVYASVHVAKRGDEPAFVGGHLGYDSSEEVAAYHTDSPILEVLS